MPDYRERFDSPFVKANVNVKEGDSIRFLDSGEDRGTDDKVSLEFEVEILHNGEVTKQKKFTMNKTNYNATAAVYGYNTDKWVKKEMGVSIIKARNPQTGGMVDSVMLVAPSVAVDEEEDTDNPL
ncbi:MAG TPA: hypothetical protein VGF48_05800 [Thermoanaerobaculia bacterium]|jgi:hypothetical protein